MGSAGISAGAFLIPPGATLPEIQLTLFPRKSEPHMSNSSKLNHATEVLVTIALLTPRARNRVVLVRDGDDAVDDNNADDHLIPRVVSEVPEAKPEHLREADVWKMTWAIGVVREIAAVLGRHPGIHGRVVDKQPLHDLHPLRTAHRDIQEAGFECVLAQIQVLLEPLEHVQAIEADGATHNAKELGFSIGLRLYRHVMQQRREHRHIVANNRELRQQPARRRVAPLDAWPMPLSAGEARDNKREAVHEGRHVPEQQPVGEHLHRRPRRSSHSVRRSRKSENFALDKLRHTSHTNRRGAMDFAALFPPLLDADAASTSCAEDDPPVDIEVEDLLLPPLEKAVDAGIY
ncbi:hypothetical protein BBJ28_00007305, partial [Nothophytophthora sp. Chile5]